ncbi:MAG: phosphoribosylamine--glycine ligase [Fibrobacteria bacterium]|nr:phosphoribosylamine--glycine ligase [Fibrobacteria bacterium]
MKVLIIGSGGREHSIGRKVAQSPKSPELIFAPGNPGMACLGTCFPVSAEDPDALLDLAKREMVDLTIVGPEVSLVLGIVDKFESEGLKIFGPNAAAARLEGSKAFSKDFMAKYHIPTADFQNFTELEPALSYLKDVGAPIVIKASGLAAGKGAIVCMDMETAVKAVTDMLGPESVFGESGKEVVIEECMVGEEASILAVCDGNDYVLLSSSQDHKRVNDNDEGLNTGGMGAYSPAPVVTSELLSKVEEEIIKPTLEGMKQEGCPYKGVLYAGIMDTETGPRVVEYNCRLGDPEAQVVLPMYKGDILDLVEASISGQLSDFETKAPEGNACIVVMAAGGYPGSYKKDVVIEGLDSSDMPANAHVIHAGTTEKEGKIVTSGGRVLGLVGQGASLKEAIDTAYQAVSCISFTNAHYRKDIGKKGLSRLEAK